MLGDEAAFLAMKSASLGVETVLHGRRSASLARKAASLARKAASLARKAASLARKSALHRPRSDFLELRSASLAHKSASLRVPSAFPRDGFHFSRRVEHPLAEKPGLLREQAALSSWTSDCSARTPPSSSWRPDFSRTGCPLDPDLDPRSASQSRTRVWKVCSASYGARSIHASTFIPAASSAGSMKARGRTGSPATPSSAQLVDVHRLVTDVEREQQWRRGAQDTPHLGKSPHHLVAGQVNDGVERDDAREGRVRCREGEHRSRLERHLWGHPARDGDEVCGTDRCRSRRRRARADTPRRARGRTPRSTTRPLPRTSAAKASSSSRSRGLSSSSWKNCAAYPSAAAS